MTSLPLGNDNDLDDAQFYNRVDEISFLSDNLELTKKDQLNNTSYWH